MPQTPWLTNRLYRETVKVYGETDDLQHRELTVGKSTKAVLLYCDGSVDSGTLSREVIFPLSALGDTDVSAEELETYLIKTCCTLSVRQGEKEEVLQALSYGNAILYPDKSDLAWILDARPKTARAISEPSSENITKGAKDCLNEQVKVNVSLLRKRLSTPDFQVKNLSIGRRSMTSISIVSLRGIVNPDVLSFAEERLRNLDIDCICSLGVIEEALRDGDGIFPQTLSVERPDRICSFLNEGCVAILIDGFPFAIIGPVSILHHMSTADDYSRHHIFAGAIRILRYFLLIIALLLPAFYVSVATYHQEMLPTKLASTIIRTRLDVPFNDLIETVVLLVAFEILLEAGLRIPQNIGQTVSIVGGLIVGEAAVNAKLISPIVVIIVAISVIATFTLPDQDFSNAVRLSRLLLCLVSSVLGLAGMSLGAVCLTVSLCSSRSFGISYMAPLSFTSPGTKDTFFRRPFSRDLKRPAFVGAKNQIRRKDRKENSP